MSDLPTGEVTFLFTDIEGSTRLVESLGDEYARLLADHCSIIRSALKDGGGIEVSTQGDSFFAVFPDADGAVAATVGAQKALAEHSWPDGAQVRVRMGLHTGRAAVGGENYIGLDVHRAARIAAAGHGGQVLLSDSTRAALATTLPGASLRDLGQHRLKDLSASEHLFQIDIDGLSADFPEIRSLDARPNNLPAQVTSFIGRDGELAAVSSLLDRARLVTLTGPGGTGKTRLAIEIAAGRLTRYADGAFFVDLAPLTDRDLVLSTVAHALGLKETPGQPLADGVKKHLVERELLLVLDNFEQVLEAVPLVSALLSAAPRLTVLATSRSPLRVSGEHEYPVPPLPVPDAESTTAIDELSHNEAVALFVERAVAARATFRLTEDTARPVARIVKRLDGLPLAVELAAAKVRVLQPDQIEQRLGEVSFLSGGPRDLPARQRTLRATIDWSYNLLPDELRVILRRLGVFVGGWTLEAGEAVTRPTDFGVTALDGHQSLLEQSLIRGDQAAGGDGLRFDMLETIRQYATEMLQQAAEADTVRERHSEFFTTTAEEAAPRLTKSAEALNAMALDHDNYRAALTWSIEHDQGERALRLVHALWRFWQQRGHFSEGRAWAERALALPSAAAPTAARAKGLTGAAGIAYWQNDYPATVAWYAEAEDIIRTQEDPVWLADALYNSGEVALLAGQVDAANAKLAEAVAIARGTGDENLISRFVQAEGYLAFMTDDLDRAQRLLEEGLAIAERGSDQFGIAIGNHTVAQVARLQGRLADAAEHYRRSLRVGHGLGDAAGLTEPLQGLAAVEIAAGDAARGVRLLAASASIRERLGGGPPPEWLRLGDPLADARAGLGDREYQREWEAGSAFDVDRAVADALASERH